MAAPRSGPLRPDPDKMKTRLLIVSEMLDKAVEELARVMEEIKTERPDDPVGGE